MKVLQEMTERPVDKINFIPISAHWGKDSLKILWRRGALAVANNLIFGSP